MKQPTDQLLTTGAVARLLGISQTRVKQLQAEGRLTSIRDSTGRHLFAETAVEALRQKRARKQAGL